MGRFSSKCAVITGGNRGIGYAIAQRFVSEGANVIIASIEEQVMEAATALGDTAKSFVCNVTDQSQVVDLYNFAEAEFGGVDISVQNAGIITIAKVEDLTEREWDDTMAINTKGVFLCCQ